MTFTIGFSFSKMNPRENVLSSHKGASGWRGMIEQSRKYLHPLQE